MRCKLLLLQLLLGCLSECGRNQTDRTMGGAASGAGTGAVIGPVGGPVGVVVGALIGGGLGAASGAAVPRCRGSTSTWDRRPGAITDAERYAATSGVHWEAPLAAADAAAPH